MKPDAYKAAGFREALAEHMTFVKAQFSEGIVLFSGTKPDNSGGVRVLKIDDASDVAEYWMPDPMAAAGLLEYKVTAFAPLDVSDGAKNWFE